MRKGTLLAVMGLVTLGIVSGLAFYGQAKEKDMGLKKNTAKAARPAGAETRLKASLPEGTEIATFAMG